MKEIIAKAGLEDTAVFKLTPKKDFKGIIRELKENKHKLKDATKIRLERGGAIIILEYTHSKEILIFNSNSNATKYKNYINKILRGAI